MAFEFREQPERWPEYNPGGSQQPTEHQATPNIWQLLRRPFDERAQRHAQYRQEAQNNGLSADILRSATLDALASAAVQERLGAERATDLQRIAFGMGAVALGGPKSKAYPEYSAPADNGVYLVPVTSLHEGTTFRVPFEPDNHEWKVVRTRNGQDSMLDSHDDVPYQHVITIEPGQKPEELPGNIGMVVHQLVRVEQANQAASWRDWMQADRAQVGARIAESYTTQFAVMDVLLDGALTYCYNQTMLSRDVEIWGERRGVVIPRDLVLPGGRTALISMEIRSVIQYAYAQIGSIHPDMLAQIYEEEKDLRGKR
jgi:hypothetical protein